METNFTLAERIILANQFTILSKLEPDESEHHQRKANILIKGYEGLYNYISEHFSDPVPEEVTSEVHEILSMYRYITPAISNLSEEECIEINSDEIKFEGFNCPYDSHYFVADFFIDEMGLYQELKDIYLNSHSQFSLMKYRRMLPVFKKIQTANLGLFKLTKDNLIELVKAAENNL